MENLKSKVKVLVPEDKHLEIDKIFQEWIASLKVHTIPDAKEHQEKTERGGHEVLKEGKRNDCASPEKITLKTEIEELKKQIEIFKEKMKVYKESNTSTTDLALADVKEEIGRVREGILKLRVKFNSGEEDRKGPENAELIKKLDESKRLAVPSLRMKLKYKTGLRKGFAKSRTVDEMKAALSAFSERKSSLGYQCCTIDKRQLRIIGRSLSGHSNCPRLACGRLYRNYALRKKV